MIELLCEAIIREANNVIKTTQDIEKILTKPVYKDKADMLDDMRIDSVLHLQSLIASLAEGFYQEGAENERTDEGTEI